MLTLLLLAVSLAVPAEIPDLEAPEVYVTIRPSTMDEFQLLRRATPYTYTCEAMVLQAEAKPRRIYVSAKLVAVPGQTETTTQRAGEYTLDFAVKMGRSQADATVTVTRGDKVITRQRSTIQVTAPQQAGIIPLH